MPARSAAYRRSVSEERQPNVSEGRMKARRVETAERVPFTPARPEALAKGDAKLISDLMNRLRRMKVKRLFRPKKPKVIFRLTISRNIGMVEHHLACIHERPFS